MAKSLAKAKGYRLELREKGEPYEFTFGVDLQNAEAIAAEQKEKDRVFRVANDLFLDRMWALRSGGWRKYWRLLIDRDLRNRAITLWVGRRSSTIRLAVIIKTFRANWFQLNNLWRRR